MSKKSKEIALEIIVLSMEELKANLSSSAINEDVVANAEAMRILADAYAKIAESRRKK